MEDCVTNKRPKKIAIVLDKAGIDFDGGYFTPPHVPWGKCYFTAWKHGRVVACLSMDQGGKEWVLEKRN